MVTQNKKAVTEIMYPIVILFVSEKLNYTHGIVSALKYFYQT